MMDAAQALQDARSLFKADHDFGAWRQARLGWLSKDLAGQYINLWKQYGEAYLAGTRQGFFDRVSVSALRMLAQPAADGIRPDVETRIEAGEHVATAEIARLKAELKEKEDLRVRQLAEANAATEAVRRDLEQLQQKSAEKAAKASRREANLIEDKNRALADKAAAEDRITEEVRRAQEAAWAEADEKYEALVQRLNREAAEARRLAEEKSKALDTAVAQARAEAEQAVREQAELLAAQAMETRRVEFDRLKREAERAETRARSAYEAAQRHEDAIREHQEYMARLRQADVAAREQTELAERLARALNDEMLVLSGLEFEAQPAALRSLGRAAQMCRQMAQALEAFMSPRLAA